MNVVVNILVFIIIFCAVVISHEFGHFIIAKANGIAVSEFSIGMGPKIVGFHRKGTYYVLRLLPIGGACVFEGDDVAPEEQAPIRSMKEKVDPGSEQEHEEQPAPEKPLLPGREHQGMKFNDAPVWSRIAAVFAGPLFNFLLALVFAIIIVHFCGETIPLIQDVTEGSPAAEAGLQAGDVITSINGERVFILSEITLINNIDPGRSLEVTYKRGDDKTTVTVTPFYSEEYGRYLLGFTGSTAEKNTFNTIKYGFLEVRYWMHYTVKSLSMLVTGKLSRDDVSGPVGIVNTVGTVIEESQPYGLSSTILSLLNFATLISVNLGVINLLPLPALDGGRLLFLLIEAVRKKPIDRNKEAIVHFIGFILLMILMIFVFYNDIARMFR